MKILSNTILVPAFLLLAVFMVCAPHIGQAQIIGQPMALASTTTIENGHVFKATGGYLYSLSVTTSGTAGYAMVFDSPTVPSNGAVNPIACYTVGTTSPLLVKYDYPIAYTTGLSVAYSSTSCNTLTLSATAFMSAQVR